MGEFIKRMDFSDVERRRAVEESIEKINDEITRLQVEIQKIETKTWHFLILSIASLLMVFTLREPKSLWWTFLPFLAPLLFNPRNDPYLASYSWNAFKSLSSLLILGDLMVLFNFLQSSFGAAGVLLWILFFLVHAGAFILSIKASGSVKTQKKLDRRAFSGILLASLAPSAVAFTFRVSLHPAVIGSAYIILYFLLLEHKSRIATRRELLNVMEELINARESIKEGTIENFEPRHSSFKEVKVFQVFTLLVPSRPRRKM